MSDRKYEISNITETGERDVISPGYDGIDFFRIKERVVFGAAAVQAVLNKKFPANGVMLGYRIKCQAAGTITTGTHIAIGFGSDVNGISETTFTSIDAAGDATGAKAPLTTTSLELQSSDVSLHLNSTNGSGSAAGTINTGTWDVVIWGYTLSNIKTDS